MTDQPTPRASLDDLLSGPGTAGTAKPADSPGDGPGTGEEPSGLGADFEIMPRPRRRITRLTAALALLAAAAAGFAGGLHAPARSTNARVPSAASGPGTGPGPAGISSLSPAGGGLSARSQPGAGGGITGTLKAVKGSVIYITDAQGKTITIRVSRSTVITSTSAVKAASLTPGEQVTVQGTKAADGSYRAASIAAGKPAANSPAGRP